MTTNKKIVHGTDQADALILSGSTEVIYTYAGDDTVTLKNPMNTALTAYLGDGDDIFRVVQSNASARSTATVTVLAGDGNDTIYGTGQGDYLSGGTGNDIIYGSSGRYNSTLRDDLIYGGDGNDRIFGAGRLYGDAGNDYLRADPVRGSGAIELYGGTGNDVLDGNFSGRNTALYGGYGADTFMAHGGAIMDFRPREGDRIDLGFHVTAVVAKFSGAAGELMVAPSSGQAGYRVYTTLSDGTVHRLSEMPLGVDLAHLSADWFL